MSFFTKRRSGFTLIELIVVIAILAIIIAAVFVAIDPARRLHSARNSNRWTDTRAILEAIKKYQVDNEGDLPDTAVAIDSDTSTVQIIGEGGLDCSTVSSGCTGVTVAGSSCFVSGLDLDLADYLDEIPEDPKDGSSAVTYYYINLDANGFITVGACKEEGEGLAGGGTPPTIKVSR